MSNILRACNVYVKPVKALILGSVLVVLSSCASLGLPERDPVTLEQIVALAKEGKDAAAIIGKIQESRTTYDVMASQYAKLSRDGVPDQVIDYMQRGQLRMAERQGRRDAYHDLWLTGQNWGQAGVWAPRAYFVYVNGRPHARYW